MKKLITFLLIICATTGSAQIFNLGIKGGFNTPNLKIKNTSPVTITDISNSAGWHLGGVVRLDLVLIFLQPEVIYTTTTSQVKYTAPNSDGIAEYKTQRIDVPMIGGFEIGPLQLFAGPVISYHMESPMDILNKNYSSVTWGGQIGVGVKVSDFLAELKYELPFSSVSKTASIDGNTYSFNSRNSMVVLSFGYFLF